MLFLGLTIVLTMAASGPAAATDDAKPPLLRPKPAPRELGELRSTGITVLETVDAKRMLVVYDNATGELLRFLETGASWGRPVLLRDAGGGGLTVPAPRLAMRDGEALVSGVRRLVRLDAKGGPRASAQDLVSSPLMRVRDVVALGPDAWVVSLTHLKVDGLPPDAYSQEDLFGDERLPRVAVLDDDLEVSTVGLGAEARGTISSSASAGRALSMATDGQQVYAAELANYRVLVLDRELELVQIWEDPRLLLEDLGSAAGSGEEQEGEAADEEPDEATAEQRIRDEVEATLAERPERDLTRPGRGRATGGGSVGALAYQPVIRDMVWDPVEDRLVLLLDPAVDGSAWMLDLLDPDTGSIRRWRVAPPLGDDGQPLQYLTLAVTRRYLWLGASVGSVRAYRIDRYLVRDGEPMRLISGLPTLIPDEASSD
jgi:hypothetical protein